MFFMEKLYPFKWVFITPLSRRNPINFFKYFAEVEGALKAQLVGYLVDFMSCSRRRVLARATFFWVMYSEKPILHVFLNSALK